MRKLSTSTAIAAAALVLPVSLVAPSAQAANATVTVANMAFTPQTVTVGQGTGVTWQFPESISHTSTSNQGFWSSGSRANGASYAHAATFRNAGTYGYHCAAPHPGMTGSVRVPILASGSAAAGWLVRWSSAASTPDNRTFDVQVKKPGSTLWQAFRTDTVKRAAAFDPAAAGTYRFRARLDNTSNGMSSGWSPVKLVVVS